MAKRTRPTRDTAAPASLRPELDSEFANRLRDPFETNYMGVLRTNDPLLLESVAIRGERGSYNDPGGGLTFCLECSYPG